MMKNNIIFGVWEDPNKAFVRTCPKCHIGMYETSDIDTENDEITYYYICPECGYTSD